MEVRSCLIMLVNNTSLCSIQSRYSYMYVGTLSFCPKCMDYPEQVVGGHYYFQCQQYYKHAIGCYPCPYYIINREMMATFFSVRGHAAQWTLETMHADHQHNVLAGSIKRDAQKFYNCISPPIFDIPVSQVHVHYMCIQYCAHNSHASLK